MIRDSYDREDWKNYKIYVHALKSTSRSIGAQSIFEQARELEEAAGRGDETFIKEKHEVLLKAYDQLSRDIVSIVKTESEEGTDE